MKFCLFICSVLLAYVVQGQRGDELLVYSVKGDVTAIYKNQEIAIKVGNVLSAGYTIKTGKNASLTMICREGRALSVYEEGVFPVSRWKDSCITDDRSLTTKYFQYVWKELYHKSSEYKKYGDSYGTMGVVRGEGTEGYNDYPSWMIVVEFPPGLDTLNFVAGHFPLSWFCYDYNGKYQFRLYTSKTRKMVFTDSVDGNIEHTSKFEKLLTPGVSYAWMIAANAKTGVIRRRILNCVSEKDFTNFLKGLEKENSFAEDEAAKYFRIGFTLEQKHYLKEAGEYYQKAATTDKGAEIYKEKWEAFRFRYRIGMGDNQ